MTRRRTVSLALVCAAALALAGCSAETETARSFALDTEISVRVEGGREGAAEAALRTVDFYDALLDRNDAASEISRLNAADGGEMSGEVAATVAKSLELYEISGGAFDPCVGELTELWNFKTAVEPPSDGEVAAALGRSGADRVSVEGSSIALGGAKLDLGGVAKGYIGDRAAEELESLGVERAIINLGGNVRCMAGECGEKWKIGIQDPFGADGEILGYVEVANGTVATSGVYERYFEYDGERYCHILDPATGRPADSGLVSATVVAADGAAADALATACVVLGEQRALELIDSLDGVEAILVREDGSLALSAGIGSAVAFAESD